MVRGSRLSLGCTRIFLKVVWGLNRSGDTALAEDSGGFISETSTYGITTSPFVFSLPASLVDFLTCFCLFSILLLTCLTLVLPRGGGYHPPDGLSPAAQKTQKKVTPASRTSLLHPLRSFWWKNPGVLPLRWG